MDQQHSGLGIASFVLSILVGLMLFATICFLGYLEMSTVGGIDEKSPIVMLAGLGIIGLLGMDLVAGALGLVGLFQPERNKTFAVLGLICSIVTFGGVVGLMIVGSTMA